MGRPGGETTDQQPQEYDLQPQEYQYDTATNPEVQPQPQQVDENSYYDASSATNNDPNAQFQREESQPQPQPQTLPQPQYRSAPPPQPGANRPYPPRGPAQYPPNQNHQSNPLYQPPQGQNNAFQPQQQQQYYQHQQPAVTNFPPQQGSPLHPQMYQNQYQQQQQQPSVEAYPPPQKGTNFQPAPAPAPTPMVYNNGKGQVGGGASNYPPQGGGQGSPFQPQMMGYNNNNIQGSPMAQAHMAATPGVPFQMVQQPIIPNYIDGAWRTGLFDCMDDPMNAVITLLFPCLTFGQVAEIVDNGQTSCATSGLMYGLLASFIGMPFLISCGYRSKLRARFGLTESPAPDWIVHFFCDVCALCQEYRELNLRGWDPTIGWQGNVMRQNMQQAQVQMMPPMHQSMMG